MAKVGFVGLGQMGMPLAANMAKAGHAVTAFDIDPRRLQEGARHGLDMAASAAAAVSDADFAVTILPMPADVEDIALSPGGVVANLKRGALYIEMSTIDPLTVRRVGEKVAAAGATMIDAPVTRSVDMAWEGKSALLIGGEAADVARAEPLLEAVSNLRTHCGPLGNGSAMKLVNNFLAHAILGSVVEALAIGLKSGLTLETIMTATERSGTFNKILLEVLPTRAFKGDFSPGFRSALALKDTRLALDLARDVGADLAIGPVVERLLAEVVETTPDLDFTALLKRQEEQDGFTARLDKA